MSRSYCACILLATLLDTTFAIQQGDFLAINTQGPKKVKVRRGKQHGRAAAVPEELMKRVAQPTGRPDKNESAAEATGVAQNAAGDLDAFIAALITNIVTLCVMWIIASFLRQRYPLVYSKNTLTLKDCPEIEKEYADMKDPEVKKVLEAKWEVKIEGCEKPGDGLFSWWSASAAVTIDAVAQCRGMDIAMLLEFSHLAMKITAFIGLPLVLLVGPCHCFLGGYRAGAPGTPDADYLSYWGMANVVDAHPWLYWAHAIIMWLVIVAVQRMLYNAMREFVKRRREWLMAMPAPRATTVLVEGIPDSINEKPRSDEELQKYFENIFPEEGAVKSARLVKSTGKLLSLTKKKKELELEVEQIAHKLKSDKDNKDLQDSAKTKKEQLQAAEGELKKERKDVDESTKTSPLEFNLTKGFVTFNSRRDAELAKMMKFTYESDQYVVEIPPDPSDILWADLQMNPLHAWIMSIAGYACIAGVFWAYLPTVVAIAYYTSLETLAEYSATFKSMADDPSTAALWDGLVNALALQLLMGFVPTFFMIIFSTFFCIKSGNSLQHKIQDWYFYFQVIFVLLVTAIGSSLLDTLEELAEDPTSIVYLLASTLPLASHFYLNYLPLQWVTHAQNMLRLANLFKFKAFSATLGEAVAVKKAEPEDQDYYGLGSRSARFTFMLVLTLTFCTLSPLITMLGFVNFWVCRKCYGYLCVFCETKKPDLGGFFYVSQLHHVSEGLFIYIILMTGVLLERDLTMWPGLIAASGLIFQYLSYNRFKTIFRWETLSFEDLKKFDVGGSKAERRDPTGEYVQPELVETK